MLTKKIDIKCQSVFLLADMLIYLLAWFPCERYLRGFWLFASLGCLKATESQNFCTLRVMRVLKAVRGQSELVLLSHPLDVNRLEFFAEIPSLPSVQLNIHTSYRHGD